MDMILAFPGRVYRAATSTFFFVAGLTFSTWASRIPAIQAKLQLSEAGLGTLLFALPVGLMVSLPLSGWLVSKFGSKSTVLFGALLYPFLLLPLAMASTVYSLAIALFFFGLLSNLINIAMNTQAVSVEKLYGRSIMASFHGLWSVGGFAGALLGMIAVSSQISPLIHFSIVWGLTAIVSLAANKYSLPADNNENNQAPLFAKPDKALWILGIIAFCCLVCEGAMADWSGVYFKKIVETPAEYTTLGYVAFTSTMAGGRFVGDWLATRFGYKNMVAFSGLLTASGLAIAVLLPNLLSATIGFLMVGFGVSSVVPIVYSIAARSKAMSASVALAAVSTIGFMGFLVGPPLIGYVAELSSLRIAFAIIALLGLVTVWLSKKIR